MTATALAETVTASDPVRRWRLDELIRAGYPPTDALLLSGRREVDLHLAARFAPEGLSGRDGPQDSPLNEGFAES